MYVYSIIIIRECANKKPILHNPCGRLAFYLKIPRL